MIRAAFFGKVWCFFALSYLRVEWLAPAIISPLSRAKQIFTLEEQVAKQEVEVVTFEAKPMYRYSGGSVKLENLFLPIPHTNPCGDKSYVFRFLMPPSISVGCPVAGVRVHPNRPTRQMLIGGFCTI